MLIENERDAGIAGRKREARLCAEVPAIHVFREI
jgi:hypothetical protein